MRWDRRKAYFPYGRPKKEGRTEAKLKKIGKICKEKECSIEEAIKIYNERENNKDTSII